MNKNSLQIRCVFPASSAFGAEPCIFDRVGHAETCLCYYSPSVLRGKRRCDRLWWHLLWCGSDGGLWGSLGLLMGERLFLGPGRASRGSAASALSLVA